MSTDGRYAVGAGMRRSCYVHGLTVCRGRRDAQERRCPYIGVKYIGVRRRSAFKQSLKPRKDRKAIVEIQILHQSPLCFRGFPLRGNALLRSDFERNSDVGGICLKGDPEMEFKSRARLYLYFRGFPLRGNALLLHFLIQLISLSRYSYLVKYF